MTDKPTATDCLVRAAEVRKMAEQVRDEKVKAALLDASKQWGFLAKAIKDKP